MASKKDKKPTAAQRTISLFTGMADVDDDEPGRARDGSPKGMPKPGAKGKALKWTGGTKTWTAKTGNKDRYIVRNSAEGYVVTDLSGDAPRKLGVYMTIHEAGEACDKHFRGNYA